MKAKIYSQKLVTVLPPLKTISLWRNAHSLVTEMAGLRAKRPKTCEKTKIIEGRDHSVQQNALSFAL